MRLRQQPLQRSLAASDNPLPIAFARSLSWYLAPLGMNVGVIDD
jgi:hypothetical protein